MLKEFVLLLVKLLPSVRTWCTVVIQSCIVLLSGDVVGNCCYCTVAVQPRACLLPCNVANCSTAESSPPPALECRRG